MLRKAFSGQWLCRCFGASVMGQCALLVLARQKWLFDEATSTYPQVRFVGVHPATTFRVLWDRPGGDAREDEHSAPAQRPDAGSMPGPRQGSPQVGLACMITRG